MVFRETYGLVPLTSLGFKTPLPILNRSRRTNSGTEWMINNSVLQKTLAGMNFHPDIDLFASRLNAQFPRYVSFRPSPGAVAIDVILLNLSQYKFYAFPPFSVIATFLQKVQQDGATGICVVQDWPTQAWYPQSTTDVFNATNQTGTGEKPAKTAREAKRVAPTTQVSNSVSMPLIRQQLHHISLLSDTTDILLASWGKTTGKQYNTYLSRWLLYCQEHNVDVTQATVNDGLEFLTSLYRQG